MGGRRARCPGRRSRTGARGQGPAGAFAAREGVTVCRLRGARTRCLAGAVLRARATPVGRKRATRLCPEGRR